MSKCSTIEVGKRLEALRKVKNLGSQKNLADLIGVKTNRLNNWETGYGLIPVPDAIKICGITGANLDYIYRGDLSSLPGNLVIMLSSFDLALGQSS